jgi:hypothetical protein
MNYYNYFTEIEEHFVRRRGKHLLVSPMDWGLIAAWRDAGVPLQVALRGIDIAMDGFFSRHPKGSGKINSLCYCHDSVMSEFANYLESRVGEARPEAAAAPEAEAPSRKAGDESRNGPNDDNEVSEALEYLAALADDIKTLSAKHTSGESVAEGVERVRARLEEMLESARSGTRVDLESLERDLGIADEILVDTLRSAVPDEAMSEWEKEAKKELKVYRKKLSRDMYEKIHRNFIRGKIHREFDLREFSLFRL